MPSMVGGSAGKCSLRRLAMDGLTSSNDTPAPGWLGAGLWSLLTLLRYIRIAFIAVIYIRSTPRRHIKNYF